MTRAVRKVAKEIAHCLETPHLHGIATRDTLQRWLLLLAPPQKRRVVSKGTKARRATVKELDKLCREVVFLRDDDRCRMCDHIGEVQYLPQLQWCHVFSRRYRWLRWDISNSLLLCAKHHMWQHHSPALAMPVIEEILGKKEYAALKLKAAKPQKADPDKWKLYLLQEKKRYA